MNATIFARPNLKIFLFGALLIAVLQHLTIDGFSQGSGLDQPLAVEAGATKDPGVETIVSQAGQVPASHIYARLSDYYEDRGDFRKALRYLRLATLIAEAEDEVD